MKIVIRTSYLKTFLVGFKSFVTHYPELLKDLIVQVQSGDWNNLLEFRAASKLYGFTLVEIPKPYLLDNYAAETLYRSFQYEEAVSLDDDIIYLKPGLFDFLSEVRKATDSKIIGVSYPCGTGISVLDYHLVYIKNASILKTDFLSNDDALLKYDGCDTGELGVKHANEIYYFNVGRHEKFRTFVTTEFYIHVGGVTCALRNIEKVVYDPDNPRLGWPDTFFKHLWRE